MHTDHLNAPRKVAQPTTGTLAWRWDTDPFGTSAPNQNPAGLGTFPYNLRFPGQYYDAETGLNQNWNRDYDPVVGRYVESDRLGLFGGSFSTYSYVSNAPVIYVDPTGLCWYYFQSTGLLYHVDADGNADFSGYAGYSGYGYGKNNPVLQSIQSQQPGDPAGPIPQGYYQIGPPRDSKPTGPYVLDLTPWPGTNTYGRTAFEIHGEKKKGPPGYASTGCVIEPPDVRQAIVKSKDNCLKVVP